MAPHKKTYLLVPNFDYPVDGPISLGNIITDPFTPHRAIASLKQDEWPQLITSTQISRSIVRGEGKGLDFSIWAQVLQAIGANVGAEYGRDDATEYTMDLLRTSYFKTDPSDEAIQLLLTIPRVANAMRSTFGGQSVFMVTGVKVAEGFSLSHTKNAHSAVSLGVSADAGIPGLSIGADTKPSKESRVADSFKAGNQIVLAYQLLRISQKGWRRKALAMNVYYPKAAFLGDEEQLKEPEDGFEAGPATIEDLAGIDESVEVNLMHLENGDKEEGILFITAKNM